MEIDQNSTDFEGLPTSLWAAMYAAAQSGHTGPNHERIMDGCIWVTQKEWDAIFEEVSSPRYAKDRTKLEKLNAIPVRIVPNDAPQRLEDGRIVFAFNDVLYVMSEPAFKHPPLPRLYIDGVYVV
jgi:hypothetical protein